MESYNLFFYFVSHVSFVGCGLCRLDAYIYDHLVKKKLHNTAKSFMTEGKVSPDLVGKKPLAKFMFLSKVQWELTRWSLICLCCVNDVAIDAPGGFLFEWWSVFWEMYYARTKEKHDESAVEYGLNVYIYDYLVKKKLHYTANSFMTEVKVSPDHVGMFLSCWLLLIVLIQAVFCFIVYWV